ncbi:NAD(P)H-dependent oxidoreductase [Secundilactobacillus folii]|nr:NAD(P)H-dependent oxidoreductase [Secundilactobacillus folii]
MKILLINGYTPHPDAGGKLTQMLVDLSQNTLAAHNDLQLTAVTNYQAGEEYEKFRWADLILLFFPLYWYAVPWGLKRYIDDVFALHKFYDADENGQPVALMTGKQFAYVTTLAAVPETYAPNNALTKGLTVPDLLQPLDISFRYVGIDQCQNFHNQVYFDVYNAAQIPLIKAALLNELAKL